jgi:hypothetical protein
MLSNTHLVAFAGWDALTLQCYHWRLHLMRRLL